MSFENNEYSEDELVAPEWLNEQFLESIFQSHEQCPDLKIQNVSIMPATKKGDHFGSIMFRVAVEFLKNSERIERRIIVKAMPEVDGLKKDCLKDSHIFNTEIKIYQEVIPLIEKALHEIGDKTAFAPKLIYGSLEPIQVLVLEDLGPLGYKPLRARNLNREEAMIVLSKIAKWHSVCLQLIQKNPKVFDKFRYGLTSLKNLDQMPFICDSLKYFVEMLQRREKLQKYLPYFEGMKQNFMQVLRKSYEEYTLGRKPDGFYVICHGDLHGRNVLLKHNEITGSIEDVLLVDFQISYLGPICNDLIFAHATLIDTNTRMNCLEELDRFYAKTVEDTLKKIQYKGKIPNFQDLENLKKEHEGYELFLYACFLPYWYGIEKFGGEISGILDSPDFRKNLYQIEAYADEIELLLPRFFQN